MDFRETPTTHRQWIRVTDALNFHRHRKFWLFTILTMVGVSVSCFFEGGLLTNSLRSPPVYDHRLVDELDKAIQAAELSPHTCRVALFHKDGAADDEIQGIKDLISSGCNCEFLSPTDIRAGALANFNVIVFPGGSGSQQSAALGESGRKTIVDFVYHGGGYVGICGGAFLAAENYDWSLGLADVKTMTGEEYVPGSGILFLAARPSALVKMELTSTGEKVLRSPSGLRDVQYTGGPILSPANRDDLPDYLTLAFYRTEVCKYEQQRGTMVNTPAIIAARFGNGHVILFSPHAEMTPGLKGLVINGIRAVSGLTTRDPK